VHASRLKVYIPDNFSAMTAASPNRDVLLIFDEHVGAAQQQLHNNTDANHAIHLMHA
jgi:hypothetical protein